MKLKLQTIITNDETGEILAKSESYGWSANPRGLFESAEENMGKLERFMGKKEKENPEEYMELIADQQVKVTGHVR